MLVGLRRSGNSLQIKEPIRNENDLALQALFPLCWRLCPARGLHRKFRSLGLPPLLFPALQGGQDKRGVSQGAPGVVSREASSTPARPRSSESGGECLWTFIRCARARLCLFSPFRSWGGGGCSVAADSPCPSSVASPRPSQHARRHDESGEVLEDRSIARSSRASRSSDRGARKDRRARSRSDSSRDRGRRSRSRSS